MENEYGCFFNVIFGFTCECFKLKFGDLEISNNSFSNFKKTRKPSKNTVNFIIAKIKALPTYRFDGASINDFYTGITRIALSWGIMDNSFFDFGNGNDVKDKVCEILIKSYNYPKAPRPYKYEEQILTHTYKKDGTVELEFVSRLKSKRSTEAIVMNPFSSGGAAGTEQKFVMTTQYYGRNRLILNFGSMCYTDKVSSGCVLDIGYDDLGSKYYSRSLDFKVTSPVEKLTIKIVFETYNSCNQGVKPRKYRAYLLDPSNSSQKSDMVAFPDGDELILTVDNPKLEDKYVLEWE